MWIVVLLQDSKKVRPMSSPTKLSKAHVIQHPSHSQSSNYYNRLMRSPMKDDNDNEEDVLVDEPGAALADSAYESNQTHHPPLPRGLSVKSMEDMLDADYHQDFVLPTNNSSVRSVGSLQTAESDFTKEQSIVGELKNVSSAESKIDALFEENKTEIQNKKKVSLSDSNASFRPTIEK